jgi:hypothetical protein
MQDLIAVNHFLTSLNIQTLKREALMFNRIAVSNLNEFLSMIKSLPIEHQLNFTDYEWLCEEGILFEAKHRGGVEIASEEYQEVDTLAKRHAQAIKQLMKEHGFEKIPQLDNDETMNLLEELKNCFGENVDGLIKLIESEEFKLNLVLASDYSVRGISIELRLLEGLDTYPMLLGSIPPAKQFQSTSVGDVVEITFKALPVPEENTPWEDIVNFRKEPEAQKKFLALRNWINEVARMKLSPNEVTDKLEALISEYREYMERHKIKTRFDTLKTIVVTETGFITSGWLTGLGALPGIIGMVVTPLYSIKQGRIALLEKELEAPGREIAYIVKAKETF